MLKPNFSGEGVPEEIRRKIKALPDELFYPHAPSAQTPIPQPKQSDNIAVVQQLASTFQRATAGKKNSSIPKGRTINAELVNLANSLVFPEPDLIEQVNKRNVAAAKKKQESVESQRKAEEQRKLYIEMQLKPRQERAHLLYKQFADRLEEFVDKTCKQQPDTLLHELYKPGYDHYLTAQLLRSFEKNKGKIPNFNELLLNKEVQNNDNEQNNSEDEALKKIIDQRRREREMIEELDRKNSKKSGFATRAQDIDVQVAEPNMDAMKNLIKQNPALLQSELARLQKEKEQYFKKLDAQSKRKQFKLLLQMKQLSDNVHTKQAPKVHQQQQRQQFAFMDREDSGLDPWTTFMFDQYIRPAEKQSQQLANSIEQAMKASKQLATTRAYTVEEGDVKNGFKTN